MNVNTTDAISIGDHLYVYIFTFIYFHSIYISNNFQNSSLEWGIRDRKQLSEVHLRSILVFVHRNAVLETALVS